MERVDNMDKKADMPFTIKENSDGTYTAYIAQQEKRFPNIFEAAEWCCKIRGETDG